MATEEKGVLVIGLVCLDIAVVCDGFPEEDTDRRTSGYFWQKGGNAANTSSVLALLGVKTEFLGCFASDLEGKFLQEEFDRYGVYYGNCITYKGTEKTPTSVIIINSENGSRTIMHTAKNLPEVKYSDFTQLNLSKYKWIHFEGRPTADEMSAMMSHIDNHNRNVAPEDRITTSLELEKIDRTQLEPLMDRVDYCYVSKEMAMSVGCFSKEDAVNSLIKRCRPGSCLVCPWGDQGAVAMNTDGVFYSSPAFSPEKIVDTLGAGDTFIATTISRLTQSADVEAALRAGCKVAGAKCGFEGYMAIKDIKL